MGSLISFSFAESGANLTKVHRPPQSRLPGRRALRTKPLGPRGDSGTLGFYTGSAAFR